MASDLSSGLVVSVCLSVPPSFAALQSGSSYNDQQPSLERADPEIFDLLQHEQTRQFKGLELIASEVRPLSQPATPHCTALRIITFICWLLGQ